jgi:membrane-associated phospholipid phosphatase
MNTRLIIVMLITLPFTGFSQQVDTLMHKLDSLSQKTDSAGGQVNNTDPHAYDANTHLNFKSYFTLLGSDFKQVFTKPFHITKKDWGNIGKFTLVAGALAFADEPIQQNVSRIVAKNSGVGTVSKFVTNFGSTYEVITLAAFGSYGLIAHNEKMKTTTLLATQAYITGDILTNVLKYVGGRTRPSLYSVNEDAEPQFLGPFPKKVNGDGNRNSYSSFPSGHATVAFAAATVFALEYRNKPWVPILAYTSATIIGLSRITENKHWATDVLAGAAIGFLAGKNVVNNYHRYAKLKAPGTKRNHPISMHLQYSMGHFQPALSYKF